MTDTRIRQVRGREILDSRGRPTVEANVTLVDGTVGRASVPSGASTGRHEAVELRDGDPRRYRGYGVRTAVAHVNEVLGPAVAGLAAGDQRALDARLIALDGTPDRGRLGANALLAVSLAACRAAALARRLPLYRQIAELAGIERPTLPLPMVNIISGGLHAGGQLDIQDVLAIPTGAPSFAAALEQVAAIYLAVRADGHPPLVADEGGWAPCLAHNEDALAWVHDAIAATGVAAALAVDVAATHFFSPGDGSYSLKAEGRRLSADDLVALLGDWADRYAVVSVEDGLAEDDWAGWQRLTRLLGDRLQLLGGRPLHDEPRPLATWNRGAGCERRPGQGEPDRDAVGGAGGDPGGAGRRLPDGGVGALRRDRGRFPGGPGGGERGWTDQGRFGHALVAAGQVESVAADRGAARGGCLRGCRRARPARRARAVMAPPLRDIRVNRVRERIRAA